MLKKIVLAAAVAVSTSFATWDYFPVLESHKGQAKLEFGSEIQDPSTPSRTATPASSSSTPPSS